MMCLLMERLRAEDVLFIKETKENALKEKKRKKKKKPSGNGYLSLAFSVSMSPLLVTATVFICKAPLPLSVNGLSLQPQGSYSSKNCLFCMNQFAQITTTEY